MTYQPTTRLLTALELLQARGSVSGSELAARLEVDRRSVRRYIVSLQDLGIPIEGVPGPGGGYRLGQGHRMAPLLFTGPEAIATALGLLELRRGGPRVDPAALTGAIAKLERTLPHELRRIVEALDRATHLEPGPAGVRPAAGTVAIAATAALDGCRVAMTYRAAGGQITRRQVDPYGVAGALGHWYLVGWCHLRRGIRSFRLDRVVGLDVSDERFEGPPGFDALDHLTRGIATMPSAHILEIRFGAPLADVAARVPPAYARLAATADGVIARYPADDLDLMAAYVASLDLPFEVLGPEPFKVAIRGLAERLMTAAG